MIKTLCRMGSHQTTTPQIRSSCYSMCGIYMGSNSYLNCTVSSRLIATLLICYMYLEFISTSTNRRQLSVHAPVSCPSISNPGPDNMKLGMSQRQPCSPCLGVFFSTSRSHQHTLTGRDPGNRQRREGGSIKDELSKSGACADQQQKDHILIGQLGMIGQEKGEASCVCCMVRVWFLLTAPCLWLNNLLCKISKI